MKRIISMILLLVSVFALSACGAEDYKYSQFPSDHYNSSVITNGNTELTNGAMLRLGISDLSREKYSDNDPNFSLNCLFDEESKTIVPLCFNAVCDHDTGDCFARYFYSTGETPSYGIYKDEVFVLTDNFQGEPVDISVCFMSLDGTVQRKVVLDKRLLEESVTDEKILPLLLPAFMVPFGDSIYFSVIDNIDAMKYYEPKSTETITHWIMQFNMVEESFEIVAKLEMPNTVKQTQHLYVCEGKIMMDVDGIAYVADMESGEVKTVDHAEIVSGLIEEGKLPKGGQLSSNYVVHKDLIWVIHMDKDFTRTEYYVDPKTGAFLDLSAFEVAAAKNYAPNDFCYEGVLYLCGGIGDDSLIYYNCETKERIEIDRHFADNMLMSGVYATSENGIILTYYPLNEDGTVDNGVETVMENGVEVNYYTSNKYLYVTKEDFLDGKIDSPLFFDIETGTFS